MKVLVTGGGGFLGLSICRSLRARELEVTSLSRTAHPELNTLGVKQVQGDIANLDAVIAASRGCDAIFHVAAKAGFWGRLEDYYAINVTGTDNVLAACSLNHIKKLIFTSTPSVVHDGKDLEGVNESTPYPHRFSAFYPATKAIAEKRVLAANNNTLSTVALRPHLIWGPGDPHFLPRLVERAKTKQLKFIGNAKMIDTVYVENASDAHLNAYDKLAPGSACAGRAYFITQDEPTMLDVMVNKLLRAANVPPVEQKISYAMAYSAGFFLESFYGLLRREQEPPMTRFLAEQLSTAHWFSIANARRDLGYAPKISVPEGLAKLTKWWAQTHRA